MAREVTLYRVYPEKIMVSGDRVELSRCEGLSPVYEPDKSVSEFANTRDSIPIRAAGRTVGVHETERLYFALDQPLEDVLRSAEDRAFACGRELAWEQGRNKEIKAKVRNASLWQRIRAVLFGGGELLGSHCPDGLHNLATKLGRQNDRSKDRGADGRGAGLGCGDGGRN